MRKLRLREVKFLFRFPQRGNGRESAEPGLAFPRAVVLIQGWFWPCGTFWKVWRHLWLSHLGGGYCWHLECGGQGCYKHPTIHRTALQWRISWPQMAIELQLRNLNGIAQCLSLPCPHHWTFLVQALISGTYFIKYFQSLLKCCVYILTCSVFF